MTLPEEISELSQRLGEILAKYDLSELRVTCKPSKKGSRIDLGLHHQLGCIETPRRYFYMPGDVGKMVTDVSAGIAKLTTKYTAELSTAHEDLASAEKDISRCEDSIATAARLDPGVLDQIVMAIEEESPSILPFVGLGG